jgi:hypothetical protein
MLIPWQQCTTVGSANAWPTGADRWINVQKKGILAGIGEGGDVCRT